MAEIFDCSDGSSLLGAARAVRQAIGAGRLIVLPTDTVYGVGADAFNPEAVQRLLDAKGRTRQSPPPVLMAGIETLDALAAEVAAPVRLLAERFWPGPLTIVVPANPGLSWDLGETGGTVALRIPDHAFARELLRETGPLAVSSANTTGDPAATTVADAERMLGDAVAVYLDAGAVGTGAVGTGAVGTGAAGTVAADTGAADAAQVGTDAETPGTPSTIVDATGLTAEGGVLRILRAGALSRADLADALPQVTIEE